jgi:transaldolase/glucose-6-phosphate isomerase
MNSQLILNLGTYQDKVGQRLDRWAAQHFARRIWAKDPALWHPEPLPEITDRLGWLSLPERMHDRCEDILSFAHQIKEEGFSHVLLLGMGG